MSSINCQSVEITVPEDDFEIFKIHLNHNNFQPDKETVLLIHGYLGNLEDFRTLIQQISDDYNIIAIDLRGHGKSDFPKGNQIWSIEAFANDVFRVISKVIEPSVKLNIVASSIATAIAIKFAQMFPDRVKSLFLISGSHFLDLEIPAKVIKGINRFAPDFVVRRIIDFLDLIIPVTTTDLNEKHLRKVGLQRIKLLKLHVHRKILGDTLNTWKLNVSNIQHPVFIIAGENDKLIPVENSILLNEELANSSLSILRNSKHHLILSNTDVINRLLVIWLNNPYSILNTPIRYENSISPIII